jgi:hypothetical protein
VANNVYKKLLVSAEFKGLFVFLMSVLNRKICAYLHATFHIRSRCGAFKKRMRIHILILLLWFFTLSTFGQKSDSLKIKTIDYQVSLIPENPSKNDPFEIIQASGLISKKRLIFFKKTIGGFHENVIFKNGTVFLIKTSRNLKNTSIIEHFYFNNDELIRYDKKTLEFDKDNLISENEISAYFDSSKLIVATEEKDFNINEILKKSEKIKSDWSEFIKQTE